MAKFRLALGIVGVACVLVLGLAGGVAVRADPPPAPPPPPTPPPAPSPPPSKPPAVPDWAKVSKEQIAEAERIGLPVAFENSIGVRFVLVPAGSFTMGSPASEPGRGDDESPAHKVTLKSAFYLSIYETTNGQWSKFTRLPSLPSYAGDDRPVNYISLVTARPFVKWLNEKEPDRHYTLPTEAQWEYACRAGTMSAFSTGATITKEQANFGDPKGTTKKIGLGPPNAWGLFDMHGNVLEWCIDRYGPYGDAAEDPKGPTTGKEGVLRGGSWAHSPEEVRSACRHRTIPNDEYHLAGFRMVCRIPQVPPTTK